MPPVLVEEVRLELARSLPLHAQWLIRETPLRFDFQRVHHPLVRASEEFDDLPPLAVGGATLFIFGEQDYSDGGGASPLLVLDETTGGVFALDLESEDNALRFINSTARQFASAFEVLDSAFRNPELVRSRLVESLTAIDPTGFRQSEWSDLLDYLSDADSD